MDRDNDDPAMSAMLDGKAADPAALAFPARLTRVCNVVYCGFDFESSQYPMVLPGWLTSDQAVLLEQLAFYVYEHASFPGDACPVWDRLDDAMGVFRLMSDLGCDVDAYFGDVADRHFSGVEPACEWDAIACEAGMGEYRDEVRRAGREVVAELERLLASEADARESRVAADLSDVAFVSRVLCFLDDLRQDRASGVLSGDVGAMLRGMGFTSPGDLDAYDLPPAVRRRLGAVLGSLWDATLWRCPVCGCENLEEPYRGAPRDGAAATCPRCGRESLLRLASAHESYESCNRVLGAAR